jgi:hypothetical protein
MPKPKVVTLLHATYVPDAKCEQCVWERSGNEARQEARAHTLETGHQTRVETLTVTRYVRDGE